MASAFDGDRVALMAAITQTFGGGTEDYSEGKFSNSG